MAIVQTTYGEDSSDKLGTTYSRCKTDERHRWLRYRPACNPKAKWSTSGASAISLELVPPSLQICSQSRRLCQMLIVQGPGTTSVNIYSEAKFWFTAHLLDGLSDDITELYKFSDERAILLLP
jgi:hypothetical protein